MAYDIAYYIASAIILLGIVFIFNGMRKMIFSGRFNFLLFIAGVLLLLVDFQYLYSSWILRPAKLLDMLAFLLLVGIASIWAFLGAILFPTDIDTDYLDFYFTSDVKLTVG